jgi:hypothetical protein
MGQEGHPDLILYLAQLLLPAVVAAVLILESRQIKGLEVPEVLVAEEAFNQLEVLEEQVLLGRETMVELVVLAVTEMAAAAVVQVQ